MFYHVIKLSVIFKTEQLIEHLQQLQQIIQIIAQCPDSMIDVQKKTVKSIEDYRYSIKLLKYNLKKQKKINEKLKYQAVKFKHRPQVTLQKKNRVYELSQTTKMVSDKLKRMGLILEDLFRMADSQYRGQITKQQFMKVVTQLKIQLNDSVFTEMFYAIDSSLNNLVSQDEYLQFSIAYGGCSNAKQIRKYQNKTKTKLLGLIRKNYGSLQKFLERLSDPIEIDNLGKQLRKMNLNNNEVMIMLKTFDPTHQGLAHHKFILSIMQSAVQKTQRQQEIQQTTKDINQLCVIFRDKKINPMEIFQQADIDGQKGVSPFQLQQAFKKIVPFQTPFQIKKWVNLINYNNDKIITKDQFINAVRGFYSINQINKFSQEYKKKHPQLKLQMDSQSTQKILKQLNIAIEDKGLSRREAFDFFDFNKSQDIDKQQLIQGLKGLGLNFGFIHRVIAIFDSNNSEKIQKEQWLRILGDDPTMDEGPENIDLNLDNSEQQQDNKYINKKKITKKPVNQKKDGNQKNQENKQLNNKKQVSQIKKSISKGNTTKNQNIDEKVKMDPARVKKEQKMKDIKNNIKDKKFQEDYDTQRQINKKKLNQKNKPDLIKKNKIENKFQQKNQIIENEALNQDYQQDINRIEEQVAIKYKKNKTSILKQFRQFDKGQKENVNKKNFGEAIKKIVPSITQNQINELFLKNVVNVNQFRYKQWLNQIQDLYAQQVEQQSDQKDKQQDEYNQEYDHQQLQNQVHKQQKKKGQLNGQKTENNQKRGENIAAFQILANTLKIVEGKKVDVGYKLIDYISDEQNQLQKMRQQLLKKAIEIKNKGEAFEDNNFPPNKKSIYSGKTQCRIKNQSLLTWKHYKKIFKNPQLFSGNVQPNDIRQGNLGNCYFLSAIAGLAQYANLIQRLFQYYDIETGYFLIWLCIDGSWRLVQIDGYLPVRRPDQQLAFSHSQSEQLWVSLLEKAYAKCYGEYNNIVGGQPIQAIKDLTGAPGNQFQFKKFTQQQIWEMLLQADKKQYIMAAGTKLEELQGKVQGHQEGVTNKGIVLGHAYSILDCRVVKSQRILKLRNPWGEVQWTGGNWADNGKKWTKEIKKELNYQINQKDGVFWIQLQQFYKHFMACSISYLRPTFYYRSDKISKVQSFIVIISNPFNIGYVSVNHKDHRQQGLQPNTPYDGIYKLLGFVQKNGQVIQKYQQKSFLYERQGCIQFKDMNKYFQGFNAITLVKLHKTTDITVSFYGDKSSDFKIQTKFQSYLQKLAYYEEKGKQTKLDKQNNIKIWKCQIQGIIYLCFKNTGDKTIILKVKLQNLQNLKPVPPLSTNEKLKIVPGEIKNIRMKILSSSKSPQSNKVSYAYSYSVQQ